jgi:hypothetical protein
MTAKAHAESKRVPFDVIARIPIATAIIPAMIPAAFRSFHFNCVRLMMDAMEIDWLILLFPKELISTESALILVINPFIFCFSALLFNSALTASPF